MEFLYKTRYRIRTEGIYEKIKRDKREKKEEEEKETEEDLHGSGDTPTHTPEIKVVPGGVPPSGRPEWEVLTPSQIDLIEDTKLKARILEYRTYREKQRQASQRPRAPVQVWLFRL